MLRSLPTRGAWIEMLVADGCSETFGKSLPTRGAWIEIGVYWILKNTGAMSLPTRGAWIEIAASVFDGTDVKVAPHTGSVD